MRSSRPPGWSTTTSSTARGGDSSAATGRAATAKPAGRHVVSEGNGGTRVFELIALFALVAGAVALFGAIGLVLCLVKLVFHIVLIPIKLASGLILGTLGIIA